MILITLYEKSFWCTFYKKFDEDIYMINILYKIGACCVILIFQTTFLDFIGLSEFYSESSSTKVNHFKKYQYEIFRCEKVHSKLAHNYAIQLCKSRVDRRVSVSSRKIGKFLTSFRSRANINACSIVRLPFANLLTLIPLQYMTFWNCSNKIKVSLCGQANKVHFS